MELRRARLLLVASCVVTLGLNIAEPVLAGEYGKAAFDAVPPLLLIGWAEVGPGLLQAIHAVRSQPHSAAGENVRAVIRTQLPPGPVAMTNGAPQARPAANARLNDGDLLAQAARIDADHRAKHHRPASADTLRRQLRVGARRARLFKRRRSISAESGRQVAPLLMELTA